MPAIFSKMNSQSVVDIVVEQITNAIIKGDIAPGERLPSELDLVEQMGVGRNSVREAIKVLSAYGVVEQRKTGGTYVCNQLNNKLLNPLIYGLIIGKKSEKQLLEFRQIIEQGIMHLAIANADAEDVKNVCEAMKYQKERAAMPDFTYAEMTELDIAFHSMICKCTHNEFLEQIFSMLNTIMKCSRLESHKLLIESGQLNYTLSAHQMLCDTLVNRDEKNADAVVVNSQKKWKQMLETGNV